MIPRDVHDWAQRKGTTCPFNAEKANVYVTSQHDGVSIRTRRHPILKLQV